MWAILLYVGYALINDLLLLNMGENAHLTYLLLSIYTLVEYLIVSFFIYRHLSVKQLKTVIFIVSLLFTCFTVFAFNYLPNEQFDSLSATTEAIIIIVYCIFFLYEQMNKPETLFIYLSFKFWIVAAFLVYFAGTFFLFISTLTLSHEQINAYWPITLFSNICKNILLAVAFSMKKETQNPKFERPFNI